MFTVETDPAYWDHCVEWSGGGEPATQEGGQTFYTGWDTPGTKTVTASWCGGTSSQSKQVKVIEVGSVSEDKTKACVNEDITFTANPSPSGPLDCMEWQYHYRPDSTSEWEEWTRVIDEDETTVLNTSTAGYYQYRAKNHVHDEGWKESSEVEIVNCDPCDCEECINGICECAVEIGSVSGGPSSLPPDCPAVFTVSTVPAGREDCVEWSGGGNPATQSGGITFETSWDSLGSHTVRATSKCDSSYYDEDSVTVEYQEIIDLEDCDVRIARPGYVPAEDPTIDGCSNPIPVVDPDNPTGSPVYCGDSSFLEPCNEHDTGYRTCNRPKPTTDVTFYEDMKEVCSYLLDDWLDCAIFKAACYANALIYYEAVLYGGGNAWTAGQITGCVCTDCW